MQQDTWPRARVLGATCSSLAKLHLRHIAVGCERAQSRAPPPHWGSSQGRGPDFRNSISLSDHINSDFIVLTTMFAPAGTCSCGACPRPTCSPQLHSTALHRTSHHRLASPHWPAAAACSRTAPLGRSVTCQALPGPSEMAILADVGEAAVSGLGNAIDNLVSSGGSGVPVEIAQVGITPAAGRKHKPLLALLLFQGSGLGDMSAAHFLCSRDQDQCL